jgi:hypothetical protein
MASTVVGAVKREVRGEMAERSLVNADTFIIYPILKAKMRGVNTLSNFQQFDLLVFARGGFAEGLRLFATTFDDVLVEQRVVGDWIIAVVTRHAEIFLRLAGRCDHAGLRQIVQ